MVRIISFVQVAPPDMKIMENASVRQSLRILDVWLYEGALVMMSQLVSCWMF